MIWFVVAAGLSAALFAFHGAAGSRRFWAAVALALGAFALSLGREPTVIFLAFFMVPTFFLGLGAAYRRVPATSFIACAASDAALALALFQYQAHAASWSLPAVGGWGAGAGLGVVAAALRLGAPVSPSDRYETLLKNDVVDGTLVCIGWWQGAMLAWWLGSSWAAALAVGGLVVWVVFAAAGRSNLSMLGLAGGALAIVSSVGAGRNVVVGMGMIGMAAALGERLVSAWALALLPLSFSTRTALPAWTSTAVPAVLFPVGWSAMAARAGWRFSSSGAKLYLSAAAFVAAIVSGVIAPSVAVWMCYGAGVAAAITAVLTRKDQSIPRRDFQHESAPTEAAKLARIGWAFLVVAASIATRLALKGLQTGFL